jgi:hypothetical protein
MSSSLALRGYNIPAREKSALARVLDRVGGSGGIARFRGAAAATADVATEAVEAGVVGGLVGLARAKGYAQVGLPASWWANSDGSPVLSAPVEAVAALAGFGFSLYDPSSRYAHTARRGAAVALGIFAAAQTEKWLAGSAASAGAGVHGIGDIGVEKEDVIGNAANGQMPRGFR